METSEIRNVADTRQVKESAKQARYSREQELNDLRGVMETPYGRRFMFRLLEFCGLNRTVFHASGSFMYFNEGARSVALSVEKDLKESCFDLLQLMELEARKKEETNA